VSNPPTAKSGVCSIEFLTCDVNEEYSNDGNSDKVRRRVWAGNAMPSGTYSTRNLAGTSCLYFL
jgi:hypothetical protein